MTENPVAAANARTRWKRETPATPATSSSVSGPARWLSMYQSAFWAGFMTDSFPTKRSDYDRLRRVSFDNPCSPLLPLTKYRSAMGGNHADHQYPGAPYPHSL